MISVALFNAAAFVAVVPVARVPVAPEHVRHGSTRWRVVQVIHLTPPAGGDGFAAILQVEDTGMPEPLVPEVPREASHL